MRKILALMLALCVTLAMTPVLAETGVSGTWYVVMTGLTVATFELNEDGTCTSVSEMNGAEQKLEGTWTQENEKVTIFINDQTLPLVLDGDTLTFNMEDLAAMGLDQSGLTGGMDPSMFSSLIRISREPGLATQAEFSAYQENGTVPEGKTKEEMDAVQLQVMSSFMLLMGSAGSLVGEQGQEPAQEQPGPELTVLEDNFYVREGYETREGLYLARVQNNNDVTVSLYGGSLILLDTDGHETGSSEYLGTTGSTYLEPGEVTFVSLMAEIADGASVESYTAHLSTSLDSVYLMKDTSLEISPAELRVKTVGDDTFYSVAAPFTNTTDQPMTGISAVIAIRDSEGRLIDLVTPGLYGNELAAGSTIILVDDLDSRVMGYCESNGLTLGQTETLAWTAVE